MQVKDKVAIVTGASSGIGMAAAKLLGKNGVKVVLAARSKSKLDKLSKELPDSYVIVTDMTKESDIRKMVALAVKHFGKVDILVNNAGRGYDAKIEKMEIKKLRFLIDLNFIGPLVAMQEVIPLMKKQGGGAIINISSGTSLMAISGISAYASLKRALNSLSLTARSELQGSGISVSVIYPYITATNFAKNIIGGERKIQPQDRDAKLPPADPPELVAEKVLEAIKSEKAEIFAHDWMKNRK